MGLDPVSQRLRPAGLSIGVVRGPQHGDEDLGLAHDAGAPIDDRELLAGIVDEDLVAGGMILAHGRQQAAFELPEQIAEAAVAIAVGMSVAILLPEHHQVDAGPLRLAGEAGPIRIGAAAEPALHASMGEQARFENGVRQITGQWPGKPGGRGALEVVLDRAARHAERVPDLPHADPVSGKPQHLSYLSDGQFSLGRHPDPLDCGGPDARGADPNENAKLTQNRPGIERNPGRLQIGIPGRNESESARDARRGQFGARFTWWQPTLNMPAPSVRRHSLRLMGPPLVTGVALAASSGLLQQAFGAILR